MSQNSHSPIDGFSIYPLEAGIPLAIDAAAEGMRIGTVVMAEDSGRTRRLLDVAGTPTWGCLAGPDLSGIATFTSGGSASVDVTVPGMTTGGTALASLSGAAFNATLTDVTVECGTNKITLHGNAGATVADAHAAWLVTKLA